MDRIYVVGAGIEGQEGFNPKTLRLINEAGSLFAEERLLELFPQVDAQKKYTIADESDYMAVRLAQAPRPVVVLAGGDPLFFGLGRYLLRNLSPEQLEFIPNVSSVQFAFSRIKKPWDDAVFISAIERPLAEAVDRIVANEKAAVLTDYANTPARIAQELLERGRSGFKAYVCENLGSPEERIRESSLQGLLELPTAPLNVLILIKQYEVSPRARPGVLGIPDEGFEGSRKQLTRQEVRAVCLAKLQLKQDLVLWDIGAGTGAVSIEADALMPNGKVFAVERSPQYQGILQKNLQRYQARHIIQIPGTAPACLEDLPDPDRIFIGGSGGHLWDILQVADERLSSAGRLVVTATTLETLTAANDFLANADYRVEITCLHVSRTQEDSDYKIFHSQNPVFILQASRL